MKQEYCLVDSFNIYYKNGDYSKVGGDFKSIYKKSKNKIYSINYLSKEVTEFNAGLDLEKELSNGEYPEIISQNSTKVINGYECKRVDIKWKTGIYSYYYSREILKVNPELFNNHSYDGFYEFLKISKALPIKVDMKINGIGTFSYQMTNYSLESIDSKVFELQKMKLNKKKTKIAKLAGNIMI
jgi:hypothetical protein